MFPESPKRAFLLYFLIIPKAKQKQDEEITLPNALTKSQAADTNVFPLIPVRGRFVSVYGNEKLSYVLSKTKNMEI